MSIFLRLTFLFFIGCTAGWVIELFYRRFLSKNNPERKWINPGFLVGPYLPIYGFGLCVLYILTLAVSKDGSQGILFHIIMLVLMALVMTAVEYIAGIIFIKGLKVKLWDYSKEKYNFQGIICPKFTLYWGLLAAIYYYMINPHVLEAVRWFDENTPFIFVVGMFFGVILVDFGYSLQIVTKIKAFAKEKEIVVHYQALRKDIRNYQQEMEEKISLFKRFGSELSLLEHLEKYYINQLVKDGEYRIENLKARGILEDEEDE